MSSQSPATIHEVDGIIDMSQVFKNRVDQLVWKKVEGRHVGFGGLDLRSLYEDGEVVCLYRRDVYGGLYIKGEEIWKSESTREKQECDEFVTQECLIGKLMKTMRDPNEHR